MNIEKIIAEELNVKVWQVEKTIELIDEGNTIPFISIGLIAIISPLC